MKENHELINQDSGNQEYLLSITKKSLKNAKARCNNINNPAFHNYGGRGITIQADWLIPKTGVYNLIRDIGYRPSESHSLDRIDVDGNYCKENCKWSTRKEQSNNRRDTIIISDEPLAILCEKLNITHSRGYHLQAKGYDLLGELPPSLQPVEILFNNELRLLKDLCREYGVEYHYAYKSIKKSGRAFEDILKNGKHTPKTIEINGEVKKVKDWCKIFNIPYKTWHNRVSRNWDEIEALTKPVRSEK